jgi:outer membrane protein assembly factor BamE (lipoprotein component of BamABCDE complex)
MIAASLDHPGPMPKSEIDMRHFAFVLLLLSLLINAGCILYEQDIEQGNVLTPEMIQQIRPGMTRKQVQFILGTPLVADAFHANRWDYYYSLKPGRKPVSKKQRITILFQGDRVSQIIRQDNGDSNAGEKKKAG